jgi:hypothetical protein
MKESKKRVSRTSQDGNRFEDHARCRPAKQDKCNTDDITFYKIISLSDLHSRFAQMPPKSPECRANKLSLRAGSTVR